MESKPYAAAVDIWAAGVVAHEVFLGFHAWEMSVNPWRSDKNPRIKETLNVYNSRLEDLNGKPEERIENLILNMLWWDPEQRFNAEEALKHTSLQTQHQDPRPDIQPGNKRPRE
ncbi:hypothetical protein MMC30_002877 [Trapelia coarctata]|nr:hypothetical protein [Trapelia coarctata]